MLPQSGLSSPAAHEHTSDSDSTSKSAKNSISSDSMCFGLIRHLRSSGILLSLSMLAVYSQGRLGLAEELHQWHARTAGATQSAAGAAPLTQQQPVSDAAQTAQALDSLVYQGDLGIATDLADTRLAVRIDVGTMSPEISRLSS